MAELIIKIAETEAEFKQINELNYQTFVEEVKQHTTNETQSLIDKFDDQNNYFIAIEDDKLIGMLALRDLRPFSLDFKLTNLDELIPKANKIIEVRLLSIIKSRRSSSILYKILRYIINTNILVGYDLILISAILNQIKLYKHIGFVEFGPIVGTETKFQPMYLTHTKYLEVSKKLIHLKQPVVINLLPGPVSIAKNVAIAFKASPISHRSTEFIKLFNDTKEKLLNLSNAKYVELLTGSGTTTNDVIAGQISLLNQKGLVISNGEFGERLIKHASQFNLDFDTLSLPWGQPFDLIALEQKLIASKSKWIWFVFHETSTGLLNDYKGLLLICKKLKIKLCTDAISAFGTEEIDFSGAYLASAVSSKGMASYSGLGFVFYNHDLKNKTQQLPSSLNLALFRNTKGIPFTISSNLVFALYTSLINNQDIQNRINTIKYCTSKLRSEIIKKGHNLLIDENLGSNSTLTIKINEQLKSRNVGNLLKQSNILVNFESNYLINKNWIQISLMGENPEWNKIKIILDYL